jgi:hypothetical protein
MCGTAYLFEAGFGQPLWLGLDLVGDMMRLSWEGAPNIWLQRTSDLTVNAWEDVQGSTGQSTWDLPTSAEEVFFRLRGSE